MNKVWVGKHWMSGKTMQVEVQDGSIKSITESNQPAEYWIAPGLIDVQVNGIGGYSLNGMDMTVNTVQNTVKVLQKGGVTRFCPTVITGTKEKLLHCIRTITEACKVDPEVDHAVIGIHVEGPFISAEDGPRGAHNPDWVRDPDWEEFLEWNEASEGRICKVTLAPEKPGAIAFIEKLRQLGIVAAIGHCNATEEQIQAAVDAGATMSTHLGNGSHPYMKRHPNYIWAQLAEDRLWAGLIADGFHLPMSTLKVMVRTKGRKAILISDAVQLAGMPPGQYGNVVLEDNGFLHLASTTDILAGSSISLQIGVQNVVRSGVSTWGEAINMATLHPAELFGLDQQGVGRIVEGTRADFIVYDIKDSLSWTLLETISNGETVYKLER